MENELRISFLGDLCPVNRVEEAILNDNFSNFNTMREILKNQDLVIVNLECPLTLSEKKIKKIGPNLKAHPKAVNLLKYLNIGIAALSNNHIFDYDEKGLSDTLNLLKESSIDYVGAGLNLKEAGIPLIKDINGVKICIFNVCEREFNIAEENYPGANPFDLISLIEDVKKYRELSDYIILFYHGGVEYYNLPSPEMFKNFKFLAGMGIDLIVCNHQHVFSGYQKLSGSYVFYGLGNFIFDWPSLKNSPWNYGIALNIIIKDKKTKGFEIIPFEQCSDFSGIAIDTRIKESIYKELDIINAKLNNDLIKKEWEKLALKEKGNLLTIILFQNKYLRYILRKTGLIKLFVSSEHQRRLLNYFICQSHSELIRESLKKNN